MLRSKWFECDGDSDGDINTAGMDVEAYLRALEVCSD